MLVKIFVFMSIVPAAVKAPTVSVGASNVMPPLAASVEETVTVVDETPVAPVIAPALRDVERRRIEDGRREGTGELDTVGDRTRPVSDEEAVRDGSGRGGDLEGVGERSGR